MDRLQAMRVFIRVAELGSFTRAAESLQLSRSRVSEAVTELERALAARLVHRTTRRVSLSDDGRAYYERARLILSDLDEAEAQLGRKHATARGMLRLAIPVALARSFVVPALPALLARHPELELQVRLENRAIDVLEEGVDCAVSYGEPVDRDLVARRLARTHLLTAAAPGYLTRCGVPRSPEDLNAHSCIPFLSLAAARPAAWSFSRDSTQLAFKPKGRLAFNSMEACVDAAVAGLGVTQVLSAFAERAVRARKLRPILREFAAEGPTLYVVYPPNRQLSARLRVVLAFLSEVFRQSDLHASA